jgi:hypothetical protein
MNSPPGTTVTSATVSVVFIGLPLPDKTLKAFDSRLADNPFPRLSAAMQSIAIANVSLTPPVRQRLGGRTALSRPPNSPAPAEALRERRFLLRTSSFDQLVLPLSKSGHSARLI